SVLVCALAPENLKREALLQDEAEAYLGDVIKPLKVMIEPLYGPLEFKFQQAINQKFGLNIHKLKAIKAYDLHALELEHQALQKGDPTRLSEIMESKGLPLRVTESKCGRWATGFCWSPDVAYNVFMSLFNTLFPEQ